MPGTARIALKESVYHILTQGNNRQSEKRDNGSILTNWKFGGIPES